LAGFALLVILAIVAVVVGFSKACRAVVGWLGAAALASLVGITILGQIYPPPKPLVPISPATPPAAPPHPRQPTVRAATQVCNDLLGGQLPMIVAVMTGQLLQLHESGKLRILALTTERRMAGAPNIPTAVESGMPDLRFDGWFSLFAPKATPDPIIGRLAQAITELCRTLHYLRLIELKCWSLTSIPDQRRHNLSYKIELSGFHR
jgi:Tripartite tricarboxylate transporter family receptor